MFIIAVIVCLIVTKLVRQTRSMLYPDNGSEPDFYTIIQLLQPVISRAYQQMTACLQRWHY